MRMYNNAPAHVSIR